MSASPTKKQKLANGCAINGVNGNSAVNGHAEPSHGASNGCRETHDLERTRKSSKVQQWHIPGQKDLTFLRELTDLIIKEGLIKAMDRKS